MAWRELLDQVFGLLTSAGYEVWMSHKGTIPVDPDESGTSRNCVAAVRNCDLFLGILTTRYGSGQDKKADSLSIVHRGGERSASNRPTINPAGSSLMMSLCSRASWRNLA